MAFTSVVQFLTGTMGTDALSRKQITNIIPGPEVPCIVETVGITETYAAAQAGVRPDVRIKVRESEYDRKTCIGMDFEGERYRIVRASKAPKKMIVLVGETVAR